MNASNGIAQTMALETKVGDLRRAKRVCEQIGVTRSTLYRMVAGGSFPRQVKVGGSAAWVGSEVDAWIKARIAARDRGEAA